MRQRKQVEIIEIDGNSVRHRKADDVEIVEIKKKPKLEELVDIPSSPIFWETEDLPNTKQPAVELYPREKQPKPNPELVVIECSSDEEGDTCCMVCFDDSAGFACSAKHNICRDCFPQYISTELDKPLAVLAETKGKIKCPNTKCKRSYSTKQITDSGQIEKYIKIIYKLGEMEGVNSAPALQADSIRTRLEEALNLTCPWCRAAFIDYEGCDSVVCSKCRKYFCGLCMVGCQNSMQCHQHAAACSGIGSYNTTHRIKKKKHLEYKQLKVNRLIENLSQPEKEWVKTNCMKILRREKIKVVL
ncbi:hypothetical protein HDV01_006925 [Terramyces sp. JEL0728]|nr:hypothetical protein HDV01_006925 [Terramyces sp. JEL0728]